MIANKLKNHTATAAQTGAHTVDSIDNLIARIKSSDDAVRGPAWQGAGPCGAPAIKPLADLLTDPQFETSRSAKRALYKIVRHAGRPGAQTEALAVEKELVLLLKRDPVIVRREALWLLSEIGSDESIAPMAQLLTDKEVREDARCALMRFPGPAATAALKTAFREAPEEFKFALADSLRNRGEKVNGYPSQRLVPAQATRVGQKEK